MKEIDVVFVDKKADGSFAPKAKRWLVALSLFYLFFFQLACFFSACWLVGLKGKSVSRSCETKEFVSLHQSPLYDDPFPFCGFKAPF
jgi:hypothetical protein